MTQRHPTVCVGMILAILWQTVHIKNASLARHEQGRNGFHSILQAAVRITYHFILPSFRIGLCVPVEVLWKRQRLHFEKQMS
jgi:hypothetical protein